MAKICLLTITSIVVYRTVLRPYYKHAPMIIDLHIQELYKCMTESLVNIVAIKNLVVSDNMTDSTILKQNITNLEEKRRYLEKHIRFNLKELVNYIVTRNLEFLAPMIYPK